MPLSHLKSWMAIINTFVRSATRNAMLTRFATIFSCGLYLSKHYNLNWLLYYIYAFIHILQGLKYVTFPYLLTLQMKRFDFDYNTMHRIKLNDRYIYSYHLSIFHIKF